MQESQNLVRYLNEMSVGFADEWAKIGVRHPPVSYSPQPETNRPQHEFKQNAKWFKTILQKFACAGSEMKKIVSKKRSSALGPRLRQLRTAAGFTQQEVADEVGVSLQTYNKWEMGRAGEPGFTELCVIAAMFGVQLNDFATPDTDGEPAS